MHAVQRSPHFSRWCWECVLTVKSYPLSSLESLRLWELSPTDLGTVKTWHPKTSLLTRIDSNYVCFFLIPLSKAFLCVCGRGGIHSLCLTGLPSKEPMTCRIESIALSLSKCVPYNGSTVTINSLSIISSPPRPHTSKVCDGSCEQYCRRYYKIEGRI